MNFLFTADDGFKAHAATAIASVLVHNKDAAIHLIYSGISEPNIALLERFVRNLGGAFFGYRIDQSSVRWMSYDKHASAANYFRLWAPQLLPRSLDRVVYLDSDVIARRGLETLFTCNLAAFPVGAVWNPATEKDLINLGIHPHEYFNSGVMVLPLDEWRSTGFTDAIFSYIRANNGRLQYWDQDALNGVLCGRWARLPVSFNAQHSFFFDPRLYNAYSHELSDPHIVHFSGNRLKPWQASLASHPFKHEYKKYRSMTPWPRFRLEGKPSLPRRVLDVAKRMARHVPNSRRRHERAGAAPGLVTRKTGEPETADNTNILAVARRIFGDTPVVAAGPFKGMKYILEDNNSQLLPKLSGTYEEALHPILEHLIKTARWVHVINVDCAEGLYAVGFARRMAAAKCFAFIESSNAQTMCHRLVERNDVADRVSVFGECGHSSLNQLCGPKTLVICDIEGRELVLLDPQRVPNILTTDVLVEAHDFLRPGISDALIDRFRETHRISIVYDTPLRSRWVQLELDRMFPGLTPAEEFLMVDERRPTGTKWLLMESLIS